MSPIFKATGFLLVLYVCHASIHVPGAHEKRFIFEATENGYAINIFPFLHIQFAASTNNENNNNNNGKNENKLNTNSNGPTVHETPFQGCAMYTEYSDLLNLTDTHECHTIDYALATLHALYERPHGAECMRDVIENLKVFAAQSVFLNKDCLCTGHVAYNINRTEHSSLKTCTHQDHMSAEVDNFLFQNGSSVGPCANHHLVWNLIGSLPTNLSGSLDCQWEIIKHFNGILDIQDSQCTCKNGSTPTLSAHQLTPLSTKHATNTATPTPTNATLTTSFTSIMMATPSQLTVTYTCMKAPTISIIAHGFQQTNIEAADCHPGSKDHVASEALVINMCKTLEPHNWKEGQHVMSVCDSVPLYTPVATFFDGKYSSQGGLAGIFVGCMEDGFKMIVQECDRNITVMHVTTGGHFVMDPRSYSIVN